MFARSAAVRPLSPSSRGFAFVYGEAGSAAAAMISMVFTRSRGRRNAYPDSALATLTTVRARTRGCIARQRAHEWCRARLRIVASVPSMAFDGNACTTRL